MKLLCFPRKQSEFLESLSGSDDSLPSEGDILQLLDLNKNSISEILFDTIILHEMHQEGLFQFTVDCKSNYFKLLSD